MSTRESFLISPIKSIQRGSVTATNGSTGTVTVTAVDTAKSVVIISISGGQTYNNAIGDYRATLASMQITNTTTLTWVGCFKNSDTGAQHPTIEWQLVEYK